jgi:hypothetical protein
MRSGRLGRLIATGAQSGRASPAPALLLLLRQVNVAYPVRRKTSDGIMGDPAHQRRASDHNEGNALDLTHDPAGGFDAGKLAEALRRQMSSYPPGRVSYLIFNEFIASPRTGWKWFPYRGPNPHRTHVHISIVSGRRDQVRPWTLT